MANTTAYQCPACTGPLHFDSALGKLKCDYCDSVYEVSEVDQLYNGKVEENLAAGKKWDEDQISMYNCSTCGAEIICDKTTVATSCPYCGNPTVIPGQFKNSEMPDCIIPFKLDKTAAVQALKKHYKGKIFLPEVFKEENHIEEIKGVYVPFWLFDGHCTADITYTAQRIHVRRSGNQEITRIDHYVIQRKAFVPYSLVPVDASKKMDNAEMDSIEPYDYRDLKPFTISYLPGYFAESYDETVAECEARVRGRVETSAVDAARSDVHGYTSLNTLHKNVNVKHSKIRYAFLPVWILNTKWKDKNFQFAMNGQTGKLVGNLPVDKGKFCKYFFSIAGIAAAVISIAAYFLLTRM